MTDLEQTAREVVEEIKCHVRHESLADVNWLLVRQSIAKALRAVREADAKVVEAEPELPGEVSAAVKEHIARFGDEGIKEVCRAVVRATKHNIAAAIRRQGVK